MALITVQTRLIPKKPLLQCRIIPYPDCGDFHIYVSFHPMKEKGGKKQKQSSKHLYSSFFLNESVLPRLSFVFVYAYFQGLDKRALIQSTINTLLWCKGEGREPSAYMENI